MKHAEHTHWMRWQEKGKDEVHAVSTRLEPLCGIKEKMVPGDRKLPRTDVTCEFCLEAIEADPDPAAL